MEEKHKHSQKLIHLPRIKQIQIQNELLKTVKKEQQSTLTLKNNEQALKQNTQKATKASQQLVQKQNSYKKEQFSFQDYSIKKAAAKEEQEEQKQNKKINKYYFNKEDSINRLDQFLVTPTLSLQNKNSKDYFKVGSIKGIQRYQIQKQTDKQESKSQSKVTSDIIKIPLSQIEDSPKIKNQNSYYKNAKLRINRPTDIVHNAQQQLYQNFQ